MVKIDRSFVLKNFLDMVYDAKQQNMSEIRVSVKELDKIAYVIYQLMSEDMSKILEYLDNSKTIEVKTVKKVSSPKVIETVKVNKVKPIKQNEIKPKIVVENNKNDDNMEEEDEVPYLYGGTF